MKPRSLYRFCSLSAYTLGSLMNRTLWLAKPDTFNDPFDCAITLDRTRFKESIFHAVAVALERSKESGMSRQSLEGVFQGDKEAFEKLRSNLLSLTREMGICCFSARSTHVLMWSHYADHHKGFCVEYDSGPGTDLRELAHQVRYSNTLPSLSLENFAPSRREDALDTMWLTKAAYWKYEKEWRVMMPKGNRNYNAPSRVRSVTFGVRMSESDRVLVQQSLRHEEGIRFKQATLVDGRFLLRVSPLRRGAASQSD